METLAIKEAWHFMLFTFIICVIAIFALKQIYIIVIWLLIVCILLFLYRVPNRLSNNNNFQKLDIVSPVDGTILEIRENEENYEIIFFIHELDPQVHWSPFNGELIDVKNVGKNINLNVFKYDMYHIENNKKTIAKLKTQHGFIEIENIKGGLSYDHGFFHKKGASINRSDPLGFMMFPSRVDLILPKNIKLLSHVNEEVVGGKTPIAQFI